LPRFLKKEDDPEKNFIVSVTVGPYDVSPPMGKFPAPWAGAEEPYEGLSNDPDENVVIEIAVPDFKDALTGAPLTDFLRNFYTTNINQDYELAKAIVTFDMETIIQKITASYMAKANEDPCGAGMIKNSSGMPMMPIPTLIYPGDKIDLPITPISMLTMPMDVLSGFGIGPPHTPMGWIYHALVATESLSFPNNEEKARQRQQEGFENKSTAGTGAGTGGKQTGKLCINMDQIREEDKMRRS
jgi:hypothetical protein